ncbi:MAG: PAS domain S-box protein [Bacteroidetes bacterium]|nr:PAS domain S-box protein [Bacteroidota bacterium]
MKSLRFCSILLVLCMTVNYAVATEDKPELPSIIRQVDSLNTLAGRYSYEEIPYAKSLAIQSLNLARSCHYQEGEAMALFFLGVTNLNQDNFPVALDYYFRSLDIYQALKDVDNEILLNQSVVEVFLRLKDPYRAEPYLVKAYAILYKSTNPEKPATLYITKGNLAMGKGNNWEAVDCFYRSAGYCLHLKNTLGVGRAYKLIGDAFIQLKQLNRATFFYQKAIEIFSQLDDLSEVSVLNTRIAHAYSVLGNKQFALEYNKKAYNERLITGIKSLIISSIINVGGSYMEIGRYDSAVYFLRLGLERSIEEKRNNLIEEAHLLLADCYTLQKNYKLSLQHYQEYLTYHIKMMEDRNKVAIRTLEAEHLVHDVENTHNLLTHQNEAQYLDLRNHRLQLLFMGIILFLILTVGMIVHVLTRRTQRSEKELQVLNFKLENEIREHKEAERHFEESENLYRFLAEHSPDVISLFDKNLKRKYISPSCLSMYGFTEEELVTRPDSFEVVDLTYRKQVRSSLESIMQRKTPQTLVYKARRKDGTSFWVENHINPMFDPVSGGVYELVTVVRDISDRMLYEEELAENERQKEVLLYEIHHRVKNNFAILISLMELQKQFTKVDSLDMPLIDLQLRVRTMSLVHEQLYHNQSIDAIPLGSYLDRLTSIISSAFSKPNIRIHTSVQECAARIEIALPLGLIVNELLTNAFKYAFPHNANGDVWIDLRLDKTNPEAEKGLESLFYILNIKDNGVGLPENFSFEKNVSTGSQIVRILIEQLEAQYEIRPQPGASFTLRFAAFPKEFN